MLRSTWTWIRHPSNPWYLARVWLAYTALGFIFSAGLGSYMVAAIAGITLGDLTNGGQFALYSASLLVGAQYLINRPANPRIKGTEWFGLITIFGVGLAMAFFALGTLYTKTKIGDVAYFQLPSVVLFVFSLLIAFIAVGLDFRAKEIFENRATEGQQLQQVDILRTSEERVKSLEDQFEDTA